MRVRGMHRTGISEMLDGIGRNFCILRMYFNLRIFTIFRLRRCQELWWEGGGLADRRSITAHHQEILPITSRWTTTCSTDGYHRRRRRGGGEPGRSGWMVQYLLLPCGRQSNAHDGQEYSSLNCDTDSLLERNFWNWYCVLFAVWSRIE